jgi:hypothetical protein
MRTHGRETVAKLTSLVIADIGLPRLLLKPATAE